MSNAPPPAKKLGGSYALHPYNEVFVPGVDGDPEFATLHQKWRAVEDIDETDVEDVMENGIIQSIRVRKRKDGRFEVIDGRQRVRWLREACKRLKAQGVKEDDLPICPAILDGARDETTAQRKMMSANYHRVEPDVLQKSEDAFNRLTLLGESDPSSASLDSLKKCAVSMRCSVSSVRNYVALQKLSASAQEGVRDLKTKGVKLNTNLLLAIASLPEEEQADKLAKLAEARASGASATAVLEAARLSRDLSRDEDEGEDDEGEGEGEDDEGDESGSGVTVEDGGDSPPKKDKKKSKKKSKKTEDNGWRTSQIKGFARLVFSDIKDGHGAGTSLPPDAVKMLKMILGEIEPRALKGATEILNRLAEGE